MKRLIFLLIAFTIVLTDESITQPYYGLGGFLGAAQYAVNNGYPDAQCFKVESAHVEPSGLSTAWNYFIKSAYTSSEIEIKIVITQGNVALFCAVPISL